LTRPTARPAGGRAQRDETVKRAADDEIVTFGAAVSLDHSVEQPVKSPREEEQDGPQSKSLTMPG